MNTTDVENYPGFPEGIMGPDLMENFEKQAARFGTEIQFEDVTALELDGDIKTVTIATGETFRARAVILSTGSAYRELGLANEKRLSGHGVSWCATCDGFFFKDQDIAVIGGGDSAMEEALFLTKFAKSVTVVHRRRSAGDHLSSFPASESRRAKAPGLRHRVARWVHSARRSAHVG
jgi:thioredoxin reductase (NADPH)